MSVPVVSSKNHSALSPHLPLLVASTVVASVEEGTVVGVVAVVDVGFVGVVGF